MTGTDYETKIKDIINDFTEKFGCRALPAYALGLNEFYYCISIETVVYVYKFSPRFKQDRDFMNSVKMHNPKVKLNHFMWALLHEVGHHMTEDTFDEEEKDRINKKRFRVMKTQAIHPYYRLPDEWAATEWAVTYANAHAEEVKNLWEKIYALTNEYKTNRAIA